MTLADVDYNEKIDYQEFMKHFKDLLFFVKFNSELQALYDEELKNMNLSKMISTGKDAEQPMMS